MSSESESQASEASAAEDFEEYAEAAEEYVAKLKKRDAAERFVRNKLILAIAKSTRSNVSFLIPVLKEVEDSEVHKPSNQVILKTLFELMDDQDDEFVYMFLCPERTLSSGKEVVVSSFVESILAGALGQIDRKAEKKKAKARKYAMRLQSMLSRGPPPSKKQKKEGEESC